MYGSGFLYDIKEEMMVAEGVKSISEQKYFLTHKIKDFHYFFFIYFPSYS